MKFFSTTVAMVLASGDDDVASLLQANTWTQRRMGAAISRATLDLPKAIKATTDVEVVEDASDEGRRGSYGQNRFGPYAAGTALEYYRLWNQGWLSSKQDSSLVGNVSMMELQLLDPDEAETVYHAHRQTCQPDTVPALEFHESNTGEDGVHHFLFRAGAKFQYLAFDGKRIIHADPSICSTSLLQASTDGDDDSATSLSVDPPDQLVTDCRKLFEKVTLQQCNREMKFKIKTASESVMDGIAVDTTVEVNGQYVHRIMCDYEVTPWSADVQLWQHVRGADWTVLKESLSAVMVVEDGTPLCELDQKNGVTALELEEIVLFEQHSMGELSLLRGYEHLTLQGTDPMPPLSASMLAMQVPASIDLRTAYSHCFLQDGAENMRNQGRCGSCWAFAGASAAMAELCISHHGNGAFASSTDRYEISISQIMACNSNQKGCHGGNAGMVGDAWKQKQGITKERDSLYMCGGGDPSKHFDVPPTACARYPWGRTCDKSNQPVVNWNFDGMYNLRGEQNMREWVGRGHAMYFAFETYMNIFRYKGSAANGVYNSHGGSPKVGAHAVALIGYGKLGADDYWLIQNSWGSDWGFGGYGRYKRGTNFGNSERYAHGFQTWVTGGTCPGSNLNHCTGDGSTWGARTTTGGGATTPWSIVACQGPKRLCATTP